MVLVEKEGLSLLEESSEEDDINEKEIPEEDTASLKKLHTLFIKPRRKKYYNDEQQFRRLGQFLSPENIERLKRKTAIFQNLEVQTSLLNKISNMENLNEKGTMNSSEAKLLMKKKRPSILVVGDMPDPSGNFSNQQISGLNFHSKKFVEEEFNKSKYLTFTSASPVQKRLSILSPELRSKLKAQILKSPGRRWGSTFLSNLDREDISSEEDFNNTLNLIVRRNVDFWNDFSRKKPKVETSVLNKMLENRQYFKSKILGKLILPEKRLKKLSYIDLRETVHSLSTNVPNSKLVSSEGH